MESLESASRPAQTLPGPARSTRGCDPATADYICHGRMTPGIPRRLDPSRTCCLKIGHLVFDGKGKDEDRGVAKELRAAVGYRKFVLWPEYPDSWTWRHRVSISERLLPGSSIPRMNRR
jgi:hypothetical protein